MFDEEKAIINWGDIMYTGYVTVMCYVYMSRHTKVWEICGGINY